MFVESTLSYEEGTKHSRGSSKVPGIVCHFHVHDTNSVALNAMFQSVLPVSAGESYDSLTASQNFGLNRNYTCRQPQESVVRRNSKCVRKKLCINPQESSKFSRQAGVLSHSIHISLVLLRGRLTF